MIIPKLNGKIAYGGDYNPEQWPESIWREDMALMRQAGVNLVSLGIFSWAKIQPGPNEWNFGWLDRILELLTENNIYVCLATATASPPAWLIKNHPDILPETAEGITLSQGSRQHYSPSSSAYLLAAERLVEKIAERYRNHPALAAWHINNEYACHLPECHNKESTRAFRGWLERKYQTIYKLNHAWGTAFWSQVYGTWDEIDTPRKAPYFSNPTQQLDFKRFTSDAFLRLLLMEKSILRRHSPGIPVTTNFMGFFKPLDYHRWAEDIDFTAWDSYPDPVDESAGRRSHAAGNDLTRSLKPASPFVLMEQASSSVNWRDTNLPKRPGLMRLWSLQSVARGGDGIMFFQWRASIAGTEKYHSSVVQHVGANNSRVFKECVQLGEDLKNLAPVTGSIVHAKVAIIVDWNAWWSVELDSRPGRIDYSEWVQSLHAWFYEKNIAIDFVAPSADFSSYELVIAPALYLLKKDHAAAIESYVKNGGNFLATYFSAIVDENDHVQLDGYPAFLRQTLGLWVEEWYPYPKGGQNAIRFPDEQATTQCDHWCDLLHLENAEALATFESNFFAGRPAFTRNRLGHGHAFYLATRPDEAGMDRILKTVCQETESAKSPIETPQGVEATLRETESDSFLFLLNHNDHECTVNLDDFPGFELLSQSEKTGKQTLPPLGIFVIRANEHSTKNEQ